MPCVLAVFGREDALERKSPISRKMREVGHSRETCQGLSPLTQSRACRVSFFCRYLLSRPKANLASATPLGTIHAYDGDSFEVRHRLGVGGVHRHANTSVH